MAPTALGSQRATPQPGPKMGLDIPAPNPAHDPGLNLALAVALGVTTAALVPVHARTAGDPAAGPIVVRGAIEAIVVPPCPTAVGTLATGQILTLTAA